MLKRAGLGAVVVLGLSWPLGAARKPFTVVETSIAEMRDALDSLRLSVKYLAFDLDATRRENAMLRKQIENQR